jgi:hypothetical protein
MTTEKAQLLKSMKAESARRKAESERQKLMAKRFDDMIREIEAEEAKEAELALVTDESKNGFDAAKKPLDVLFEILTTQGALSKKELLKKAGARGVTITESAAAQAMSRDERFQGVGRGRGAKWAIRKEEAKQ